MDTFPSITPKYASMKTSLKRSLIADMDNHFIQRTSDGINTNEERWSLTWNVTTANAATIETFLEGKEGYKAFLWTPLDETSPIAFICKQWSKSILGPSVFNITATFERFYTYDN